MKRDGRLPILLDLLIVGGALAGFAINGLLLVRHVAGGALAGCGGGSSCDELLNSRWSQLFGIPVTLFGLLVYLGLMVSINAKCRRLMSPCLGLIAGAAAWFMGVQAVLLGRFCPWCMTAHGIGVLVVLLGLWRLAIAGKGHAGWLVSGLSAAAAVVTISLLQVFGPQPVTHRIDGLGGVAMAAKDSAVHARGSGRKVEFDGGRKVYDVAALPHLGRADAPRVMVEYFDYSCAACQTMRGFLDAVMAKHPAGICVVILPVPLDRSCNHSLDALATDHPGSCDLAKLALALWRTRPEAFAAFHKSVLDDAFGTADARAKALKLVPQAELDAALRDPWIDELIQANINDWLAFSTTSKNLPKLLVTGKRILHGVPPREADFTRVIEHELGL